jgi:hypothetical protein
MNIDVNESPSLAATSGDLGARVACALKCTVIAGVIVACSAASSPANSQELPPAPEIEQVTGEKAERFKKFLSDEGYEGIQLVALAYGYSEQATLLVLQFDQDGVTTEEVAQDYFQIPPVGTNFNEAVVLYSRSPPGATTCGADSDDTRSCRRICRWSGTPYPCP